VKGLEAGRDAESNVRVWIPRASSGQDQQVRLLPATAPAELLETTEARYGNQLLYFETSAPASGEFTVDIPYEVARREVLRPTAAATEKLEGRQRALFLGANQLVPISGKPLELLKPLDLEQDPLLLARQLYDAVDARVVYKKVGTGWGRGDSNWVCDS